jgi:hypothetical protein
LAVFVDSYKGFLHRILGLLSGKAASPRDKQKTLVMPVEYVSKKRWFAV